MKFGPPAVGDALGETISGMFDIPEVDLDKQSVEIITGEDPEKEQKSAIQQTDVENSDMASDFGDLF